MVELKYAIALPCPADEKGSISLRFKSIYGHLYVFKVPRDLAIMLSVHIEKALAGVEPGGDS